MNEIEYAINDFKALKTLDFSEKTREGAIKHIDMAIAALEKQLNCGWIPVSERLPSEEIDKLTRDYTKFIVSLRFEDGTDTVRTLQFGKNIWWHGLNDMTEYVIAWQPLPEPYKEMKK